MGMAEAFGHSDPCLDVSFMSPIKYIIFVFFVFVLAITYALGDVDDENRTFLSSQILNMIYDQHPASPVNTS